VPSAAMGLDVSENNLELILLLNCLLVHTKNTELHIMLDFADTAFEEEEKNNLNNINQF
jgi:hypothetical protein